METEFGVLIVGVPEPTNRVKSAGPVAPASPVAPVPPPPPVPPVPLVPEDPELPEDPTEPVTITSQFEVSIAGDGEPGRTETDAVQM